MRNFSLREIGGFLKAPPPGQWDKVPYFRDEALFLTRVIHPAIVDMLESGRLDDQRPFLLLRKLTPFRDILQTDRNNSRFQANLVISVLNVFDFLHLLGFTHKDVKPEHILFDEEGNPKLIDFAQVFLQSCEIITGTSQYLAPELFWGHGYSVQSDLFSLGIALIEMFYPDEQAMREIGSKSNCLRPWEEHQLLQMQRKIRDKPPLGPVIADFISYSPFNRPRSGFPAFKAICRLGCTTWTTDKYVKCLNEALTRYVYNTHWINENHPILSSFKERRFHFRPCHRSCEHSFRLNLKVLYKVDGGLSLHDGQFRPQRTGIDICKSRYNRLSPSVEMRPSQSLPLTLDVKNFLDDNGDRGVRRFKIDLPYLELTDSREEGSPDDGSLGKVITATDVRNLLLRGEFSEVITACRHLRGRSEEKAASLRLSSYEAVALSCLGRTAQALQGLSVEDQTALDSLDDLTRVEYYAALGWCLHLSGKPDSAMHAYKDALRLSKAVRDTSPSAVASLYNKIATLKCRSDNPRKALYYNARAMLFAEESESVELQIAARLNRCLYLGDMGLYAREQKILHEVGPDIESTNSNYWQLTYLNVLGNHYSRVESLAAAIGAFERAIRLGHNKSENCLQLGYIMLGLGHAQFRIAKIHKALSIWDRAIELFTSADDTYGRAKALQNRAEVFFLCGQGEDAMQSLDSAAKLFSKIKHRVGMLDIRLIQLAANGYYNLDLAEIDRLQGSAREVDYYLGAYKLVYLKGFFYILAADWGRYDHELSFLRELKNKLASIPIKKEIDFLSEIATCKKLLSRGRAARSIDKRVLISIRILNSVRSLFRRYELTLLLIRFLREHNTKNEFDVFLSELESAAHLLDCSEVTPVTSPGKSAVQHSDEMKFRAIHQIAELVNNSQDANEYVQKVMEVTITALRASRGIIFLLDRHSQELAVMCYSGLGVKDVDDIRSISHSMLRNSIAGNPVFIKDVMTDQSYDHIESLMAKGIKSAIAIPLRHKDEVFGAIYVDSVVLATQFLHIDTHFLKTLGAIIAEGIYTSRRYRQLKEDYESVLEETYGRENSTGGGLLLPSQKMQDIYRTIFKISTTDFSILLLGQSGAGKEILARMIHENSSQCDGRLIAINCAAIPAEHLESELFGVGESAFTNVRSRPGKIELASRGTLFLDEIADLPLALQAKLLRVIELREVSRVGSNEYRTISFRLICSTNRDIESMVDAGTFRRDFYHRVNDFEIRIPDLCERPEDVSVLAEHFNSYYSHHVGRECLPLANEVMDTLTSYDWPGGIRELSKVVKNLVVLSEDGKLNLDYLPASFKKFARVTGRIRGRGFADKRDHEKDRILSGLRKNEYRVRQTARYLDMPESTLRYRLKKLKIMVPPIGSS